MIRLRDWTVHFVRSDGHQVRTIRPGSARVTLTASGTVLAVVSLGALLGFLFAVRVESARIADLERQLAGFRAERARIEQLAGRLIELEQGYGRLQDAVTEGQPPPPPGANIAVGGAAVLPSPAEVETATPAWPLTQRGFITRNFGSRPADSPEGHPGLDIAVPTGSYVRAIQGGRVEEAGDDPVYGKFLRIAHADGLTSLYGHNSWLFASAGDQVERLEVIALTGNTGRSSAPHLHLELARNGALLDPLTLVTDHSVRGGAATPTDTEPK